MLTKLEKMQIKNEKTFPCPVCGTPTKDFEICDVCGWQNTGPENVDGGPNHMTLKEAQQAYKEGRPID
ncbi:MAG: CPCC family cysteine-rich protein [Aerococcus sp.]|nr:CPCC family cysteine-rich protein [Aerococcus sp.]